MTLTVRAPASSANLGPGFDALGLALDLWNTLDIEFCAGQEDVVVRYRGAGSDAAGIGGHEDLSLTAMRRLSRQYGRALPSMTITASVEIPVARGLGSSAAAIVAGLVAGNELLRLGLSDDQLYQAGAYMEGHGDNIGAALRGGAILSMPGLSRPIPLTEGASLGLVAVLFIPDVAGPTWVARAELPQTVTLADAAFNLGAASGLVAGLITGDHAAIAAGMHDRLHEPPRSRLYPHLLPMTEAARSAGAVGACLSGAGPSILALTDPHRTEAIRRAWTRLAHDLAIPGDCRVLSIASEGAHICPALVTT